MLHPLEQVRDHQNPLADTPVLVPCQAPQLRRPRFAAKKVCWHRHPPNMVRLPNHSTTSGNPRKPVLQSAKPKLCNRALPPVLGSWIVELFDSAFASFSKSV